MSESRVLIDWLSFTMEIPEIGSGKAWIIQKFLYQEMTLALGEIWSHISPDVLSWELSSGRPPYSASYRTDKGITLFWNVRLGHCLMEITGQGCEYLRGVKMLNPLIQRMKSRLTRIDLAVDMLTESTPDKFLEQSQSARFKSRASMLSDTGHTEYVGSRNSERYCRVYRYAHPHPRANLLRSEFVFRKQNAKIFAQNAVECGFDLTALALGAGQIYGFEHEDWNLSGDEIALASWTPERAQGKTVRWLISQVAPAFKKLVIEGVIDDAEEFIKKYFIDN